MDSVLKALGILFLLFVGGCGIIMVVGGVATTTVVHEVQEQMEENAKDDISIGQFNQLQNGMTYTQVVDILGRHGVVQSENTLPNGLGGQLHTVMYDWRNSNFMGMNAMFQNDSLMQKSQIGLK